jgi:hypothetical protein
MHAGTSAPAVVVGAWHGARAGAGVVLWQACGHSGLRMRPKLMRGDSIETPSPFNTLPGNVARPQLQRPATSRFIQRQQPFHPILAATLGATLPVVVDVTSTSKRSLS